MKVLKQILVACVLLAGSLLGASAQAATDGAPAAVDRTLKGDAVCTRCHDESEQKAILAVYKTRHGVKADGRTPGCQSCHGSSENHLKNKSTPPDVVFGKGKLASSAGAQNTACLSCHTGGLRSHWGGSQHQREDLACTSCHTNHSNEGDKVLSKATQPEVCFTCHKEQRAQINRLSHHPIPEGKMSCSDCHNPHGSTGPKLMKRDSVNETCYTCHMEKRGPFVHEHEPVGEDCSTCHNPHGTTSESLLKMRAPFLCQSCHTPHLPLQASLTGQTTPSLNSPGWWNGASVTQGRGCVNCHSQIHGSNNPSLVNPAPQNLFR